MNLKKSLGVFLACLIASAGVLQSASTLVSADSGYAMNVTVDLSGEKKEISPYIYGINQYGTTNNFKNVTVNAARQGGNRYTGYNWETNWSNAGEDWKNSSDTNIGDSKDGPAYAVRQLSADGEKYNIPYKLATLQMAGYVAADKDGTVTESEKAPSLRWNEVVFRKNGALSMEPDLTDGKVYMDEYLNYIVKTLGGAKSDTGIQGYSLDNEPFLWNDTHPMIHSEEAGCNELIDKSIELAKVVKETDPDAEVFGPALWGMLPCITAGETSGNPDPEWDKVKGNYEWYVDYYLERMAQASQESGTRLLDVFDVHYYAQDCSTDNGKLQAARSLYDSSYKENSWLQPYYGGFFPFLPKLQASIDKYYPGTKLAVSEYNLADISQEAVTGKNVISALAETEALGAFAMNNVYFATYWGTLQSAPYVESAINLYTNYDGEGASFGDTLVSAKTDDNSKAAAFAAINGNDDSEVDIVLSNKDMTSSENAVINISGSSSSYKSAVVYAITQDHTDIRIIDVQNNLSGNKIEVELPPLSVAQIVVSDKLTDKEVYEAPDVTIDEKVYNFSDLDEGSKPGSKLIPLGDKESLKEIKIEVNSYSSMGSSYFGGGGGLCFSKLVPTGGGDAFWGFKNYGYQNGQTEIVIPFDDEFTDADENTVNASVNDDFAELQDWWAYSEKDENGSDVVVNYTKVTLVYEKDNSGESDLLGDVDNSGDVEIKDLVALSKYLVNDGTLKNKKNADMNGDTIINVYDFVMLKRVVIEWALDRS